MLLTSRCEKSASGGTIDIALEAVAERLEPVVERLKAFPIANEPWP